MYNVAQKFHQLAIQPSPKTRCRIYFIPDTVDCTDDNDVITNGTLLVRDNTDTDSGRRISGDTGVIFSNYFNTEKNIQLGCCVSNQVEMHLLNLDGALTNFTFGRCKIFLDVYDADNSTWLNCPMGVYILEQPVNSDQNVITVHGFDQMQLLDTEATWWNPNRWVVGSGTLAEMLDIFAYAADVPVKTESWMYDVYYSYSPFRKSNPTNREILEKVAEYAGAIAYFDRDGQLTMRWFTNAESGTAQVTYNGQSISIADGTEKTVDSLTVPITPTQNLNGYTKPWAGGAGENLFEPIEGSDNTISFVAQPDGSVKMSGTGYITKWTGRNVIYDLPYHGINAGDTVTIWSDIMLTCTPYNGSTSLGQKTSTSGVAVTFTIPSNANKLRLGENAKDGQVQKGEVIDVVGHFYIGKVDAFTAWSPFANVCPLVGSTGLSVYVSPTQDQQDATTYAEDWTSQAGTVYAGSIEVVAGTLKARPHYASYNGETLVGPWVSSMEEYAVGVTPTTGAEVVDFGGTETAYQLTAVPVPLLSGQNYLWASNSGILTAAVNEIGLVTIDTDQIGNQCLSVDIANYSVEKFGKLTVKIGTIASVITKSSVEYPNPKNEYWIYNNSFFDPFQIVPTEGDFYPGFQNAYIMNELWGITPYTPIQAKLVWDWSIDAGDIVQIKRNNVTYKFPIFQVIMTWRGGYVVADVVNDGDTIKPYTDGREDQDKDTTSKFVVNGGAGTVSTDLTFYPGENALVVISGAASVRTAAFIVHCEPDGTILKRDISSGSAYSYVTSNPYTVTIKNSSHNNNSGLRISF